MYSYIKKFPEGRSIKLTCNHCGKIFSRFRCHIRNNTHSCSRICAGAIREKRRKTMLQYTCKICNKSFERRKGCGGTKAYCSQKCRHIGNGKRISGENHPNWKGGIAKRSWAETAFLKKIKKEVGQCEKCGNKENLQGHHKIPRSTNMSLSLERSNIEILCANCHAAEHGHIYGFITVPKIRRGIILQCIGCGKKRYEKPSRVTTAKYCSRQCYWTHKTGNGK